MPHDTPEGREEILRRFKEAEAGPPPVLLPLVEGTERLVQETLADVGRLLVTLVGTLALVGLAATMIIAGLLSLFGFKAGDVAKLTPPGRAATLAEFAVKGSK